MLKRRRNLTKWSNRLNPNLSSFFQDFLPKYYFQDGATVLIDKKAQMSILGTEMDYAESKLASEFVFNNPNITGTCGCGESFSM